MWQGGNIELNILFCYIIIFIDFDILSWFIYMMFIIEDINKKLIWKLILILQILDKIQIIIEKKRYIISFYKSKNTKENEYIELSSYPDEKLEIYFKK